MAALVATTREKDKQLRDKEIKDCLNNVYLHKLDIDCLTFVVSYVRKLTELTSSSSLIFGAEQVEEVTEAKDKRLDSHENRNYGGYTLSEETKQKMSKPKSEETKQKIKDATNRDAEYLDILRKIKLEKNYIAKTKTRAKQQYIDARLQEVFGELSKTTLTKIRKLDTSN